MPASVFIAIKFRSWADKIIYSSTFLAKDRGGGERALYLMSKKNEQNLMGLIYKCIYIFGKRLKRGMFMKIIHADQRN